ncbi:MAG: serine hydrolase domain-containing protein, partial [Bacteroidota bacterium]
MNTNCRVRLLFLFSILLFYSCQQPTAEEQILAYSSCSDLEGMVDSVFKSNLGARGIMVNVINDEGTSCTAVAGLAKEGTSLSVDHPILIASNTKTYMAAAMMACIEKELINLDEAIEPYLTDTSVAQMNRAGYDLSKITVKQLMSHTGGIYDYVDDPIFFELAESDPAHQWTRAEQIDLAMQHEPLDTAGGTFEYADTNYLLLGEIMENLTGKPFYEAVRELIDYEKLGFDHTWFVDLEETPADLPERAQQFYTAYKVNSYDLSPTFDLYGGGGIATTISEM